MPRSFGFERLIKWQIEFVELAMNYYKILSKYKLGSYTESVTGSCHAILINSKVRSKSIFKSVRSGVSYYICSVMVLRQSRSVIKPTLFLGNDTITYLLCNQNRNSLY